MMHDPRSPHRPDAGHPTDLQPTIPVVSINRDSYDAIAAEWDAARSAFRGDERRYLETLLEGLPTPSSVLDVGCGTGRPMAEFLLRHSRRGGHRVTGIDQSAALLAVAARRFPEATWVQARIEEYPFDGRHDAVICWDSLFHIERVHHDRILTAIHRCLAPGGRLMLTVGGSEHPAFTDTMFGRRFFYDSHPPRRVLDMLVEIGFDVLVGEFTDEPTGGRDKGRYAIVARKGGDGADRR